MDTKRKKKLAEYTKASGKFVFPLKYSHIFMRVLIPASALAVSNGAERRSLAMSVAEVESSGGRCRM